MTTETLKQCSDILRSVYSTPQVQRTVDPNHGLSPMDRQILFLSSRMPVKLLAQNNQRHGN